MKRHVVKIVGVVLMTALGGCNSLGNALNPFYEAPSDVALFGEKNDNALNEGAGGRSLAAREALEAMGSYQRAHMPQPTNPVMQPAVVRLMWIPDHLNSHGDLVPAHFYYLRVLRDRPAVTDAFEIEAQLHTGSGPTSNIGYALPEDLR